MRRVLAAAGVLLVVYHVWLLAGQAWDGQLADLSLLLRWLISGGLVLALIGLRRRGISILRSRQAVAVWLLAALLHGPAFAERAGAEPVPALPEVVAVIASAAVAGVASIGLARLSVLLSGVRRDAGAGFAIRRVSTHVGAPSPDAYPLIAPRPPPVA